MLIYCRHDGVRIIRDYPVGLRGCYARKMDWPYLDRGQQGRRMNISIMMVKSTNWMGLTCLKLDSEATVAAWY